MRRASGGGNFTLRTVSLPKGESSTNLEKLRELPLYEGLAPMNMRILPCPEVHVLYFATHTGLDILFLASCQ